MKHIKNFQTLGLLEEAVDILGKAGIHCEGDGDTLALFVHVSNFIRARDILIDWQKERA